MLVKTKAIVLHTFKYNESSLIAHCYTDRIGKQSFLLKGILNSKKGAIRKAYFQPLMPLEILFNHKNKGGLNFIKEVKVLHPYNSLYLDIKKNAIVIFLSEIIYKSLKEEEPNSPLFEFLETAFLWLDTHEEIANFHLIFLIKITQFLGFYPNVENLELDFFDLENGCFTSDFPKAAHLEGDILRLFRNLLGMNFAESHLLRINQHKRRELLETLVNYFKLHLLGFSTPKSLDILHEVFG